MHARTNTHMQAHADPCLWSHTIHPHSLTHPHPPLPLTLHLPLPFPPANMSLCSMPQHNLLPLSVISDEGVQYVRSGAPTQSAPSSGQWDHRVPTNTAEKKLHCTTLLHHCITPHQHCIKSTHSLHNTTNDAQPHFILGTGKGDPPHSCLLVGGGVLKFLVLPMAS